MTTGMLAIVCLTLCSATNRDDSGTPAWWPAQHLGQPPIGVLELSLEPSTQLGSQRRAWARVPLSNAVRKPWTQAQPVEEGRQLNIGFGEKPVRIHNVDAIPPEKIDKTNQLIRITAPLDIGMMPMIETLVVLVRPNLVDLAE